MQLNQNPSTAHTSARRLGILLLGLFFLALYGRYLIGYAPAGGDIVNQYLPYQKLIRNALREGVMPYWNAFTFCGRPLMADIQIGVLYPPNWLHWLLPLPLSFALLLAAHGAWMIVGCWRLGRHWRLAPAAIALGTALYCASPFFTLKASQGIVLFIYVGAWWPWLALATARLVETPGFGRLVLLALTMALSLLAGSPQITYYGWLGAGALALILPLGQGAGLRRRGVALAWMAGAGALALGLTAVQIAQTANFIGNSFERGGPGGAGWEYITDGSLMPRLLWLLVNPGFLGVGHSELAHYFGPQLDFAEGCFYAPLWVPALLLPLAVAAWRWMKAEYRNQIEAENPGDQSAIDDAASLHRRLLLLGAAAMLLGLTLAPGQYSPVFKLFYHVFPAFNRFRVPARLMIFFVSGEALVAALALDALLRQEVRRPGARLVALGGALAGLVLVWVPFALRVKLWEPLGQAIPGFFIQRGGVAHQGEFGLVSAHAAQMGLRVSVGLVVAAIAVWLLAQGSKRRGAAWLLPALAAVELIVLAWPFHKNVFFTDYEKKFYPQSELVQALKREHRDGRVLWLDDVISWQVDQNQEEIYPNRLVMQGLPEARGYDPVNARWFGRWMNLMAGLPPDANPRGFMFVPRVTMPAWLSLMAVETVVSYRDLSAVPGLRPVWERRFREGTLRVWRNERFQGMAWAAPMPKIAQNEIAGMMLSARLAGNPATSASQAIVVDQELFSEGTPPPAPKVDARFKVKPLARDANHFRYEVDFPAPALLCLAQSGYEGWSVTVDEETGPIGTLSGAFLTTVVPAGRHTVVFDFLPAGLAQGRMLTLIAVVVMLYGLVRARWLRRKEE